MRRGGEVGMRQPVSSEPIPVARQVTNIAHVGADIDPRRMHEIHVRPAAALLAGHESLIDLFGDEPIRYFMEEFLTEPIEQPAHLRAGTRILGQQSVSAQGKAAGLVEIFGDRPGARDDRSGLFNEYRRLPGRIEDEEIPSALERFFFDEFRLDGIFGQEQPDETRMRAEGMMIKRDHSASCSGAIGTIGTDNCDS
jgi:hypothetical protein